jgi:cysteine sulfinate desulfinase/cysteine desulfurase-like protein
VAIYLDHNAGSPIRDEVKAAIAALFGEEMANPSSVHRAGQRARRALEHAREQVASLINADARQIVFTSGGTESNNLAIRGVAALSANRRKIVSSAIEHSSVLAPLAELENRGFEIVRLAPDCDGRIVPERVIDAIHADTALLTLALANAEVGAILDVSPIAAAAKHAGAILHLDAAQAAGRIEIDVDSLGCDLMTLSGHKLGAPAGIGALFVRDAARLAPQMLGGPQESGLRAGTPNLLGAVAFGAAAEAVADAMPEEARRIEVLASSLLERLRAAIPGLRLNGPVSGRLPNTLNLTFPGVLGESMLIALDLQGVQISMGSACAAGAVEPSHVLRAMGLSPAAARSSLRISLGWSTTALEVAGAAETVARVWRRVVSSEPIAAEASR